MASSVNKAIIIGNLGKDPETRYLPNGDAVTNITVATTDTWKDKNGERQEKTEWHRIKFFRKQAEIAGEYLKKGMAVYIEGKIQYSKYTDKAGVEKYVTEIVSSDMKMLGGKPKEDGAPSGKSYNSESKAPTKKNGGEFDDMDDDIPF